jgi:multicomponent Na+:H+ antiporter subunit G
VTAVTLLVAALVAGGVFFALVAAIGLLRLPDLYTRAHAASKTETLGVVLTLTAVAITFDAGLSTVKTALLLVFMFLTNPTAAHAIARAAHDEGIEPWRSTEEGDQ